MEDSYSTFIVVILIIIHFSNEHDFSANEGEDKQIQWTISPPPGNILVTIIHPSGQVLYTALGTKFILGSSDYGDRVADINNTNTYTGEIDFTLNDVRVADAGEYKADFTRGGSCSTYTENGATLFVNGNNFYVKEGEDKQIQWTISPAPDDKYAFDEISVTIRHRSYETLYWLLDSDTTIVPCSSSNKVANTANSSVTTGHIEFTLKDVKVTDAGVYKAYFYRHGFSIIEAGAILYVFVKPPKPDIRVVIAPVIEEVMMLHCSTTSKSNPDGQFTMMYKWYLNGTDLPNDNRYVIVGPQLQVKNIQRSDKDSAFACVGYENSSLLSDASDIYIPYIKYGPEAVTLSTDMSEYIKEEKSNVGTITCSADCNPPCSYLYRWKFKGGNADAQSNNLVLDNIQDGQARMYWCTAFNELGTNHSNIITITVTDEVHTCPACDRQNHSAFNAGIAMVVIGVICLGISLGLTIYNVRRIGSQRQMSAKSQGFKTRSESSFEQQNAAYTELDIPRSNLYEDLGEKDKPNVYDSLEPKRKPDDIEYVNTKRN